MNINYIVTKKKVKAILWLKFMVASYIVEKKKKIERELYCDWKWDYLAFI